MDKSHNKSQRFLSTKKKNPLVLPFSLDIQGLVIVLGVWQRSFLDIFPDFLDVFLNPAEAHRLKWLIWVSPVTLTTLLCHDVIEHLSFLKEPCRETENVGTPTCGTCGSIVTTNS